MLSFKQFIKEEIGPHEGKELSLMLQGKKPAALISNDKLEKFLPHIKNGRFISKIGNFSGSKTKFHIVAQQGEEDRMHELHSIFSSNKRPHRRIGELLGYKPEDIEHFMNHNYLQEKYLGKAINYHLRAVDKQVTGPLSQKLGRPLNKKEKIVAHLTRIGALTGGMAIMGATMGNIADKDPSSAIITTSVAATGTLLGPHIQDILKIRKRLRNKGKQ